jgi:hydrogenase-4 component F
MAFGESHSATTPIHASLLPMLTHLGLVLMAGIWLPEPLVAWFQHVAVLLG